jgi:thiol-disulfide isomerase/thioredoxin
VIVKNSNGALEISFAGQAARINEYYLRKKESLGHTDIRFSLIAPLPGTSSYSRLIHTTDSIVNRELTFFENYTSKVPLPTWFRDFEESEITYAGAGYKTAMPHANEVFGYFKDTLPGSYYDFLKATLINNPKATLSAHYFWFLDDYFLRNLPIKEIEDLSGFNRIAKANSFKLSQSKKELSGQVKDLYHLSNFSQLVKFFSDSLAIDSLAKSFELTNYEELVRVSGTRSRNELESLNLHKGDTIPNFILTTTLDSLVSIRDFSHQYLYVNFWATWCGPCLQNIPELNKLIAQFENNSNIAFLNICVESEHATWLAAVGKHKLKGINLYADGNWNSKLWAYFNIAGIPHYAIIDKQNILAENATDKAPLVKEKIDALLDNGLK